MRRQNSYVAPRQRFRVHRFRGGMELFRDLECDLPCFIHKSLPTLNLLLRDALFVFSLSDPKQNARSLLTPVSGTVFNALPHGSFGFALHGSFFNHLLIGRKSSTANQNI